MSFFLPDSPDDQDSNQGQSPLDQASDLKDKLDSAKSLKEKLSGGGQTGAGAAGEAATGTAGTAAGVNAGAAGASGAAGAAGAGVATGTGAAAGSATTAGAVGAAAGATTASGGVLLPAAAALAAEELLRNKKTRKWAIAGCISAPIIILMLTALPIIVILAFFLPIMGGGTATAGPGEGVGSSELVISKTATPNLIAKGATNAQVTYTITVQNRASTEAIEVGVTDNFTASPAETTSFAKEITGVEGDYAIGTIPAGGTNTKTFTVTIPHTDFEPGWVLTNNATVTGSIAGQVETSTMATTVVIGNPPVFPPTGCPMIGAITTPYGKNIPGYPLASHDGVDLGDGVPNNAPVYATISGNLSYADYSSPTNGELTLRVIINNGVYQVEYFHLSNVGRIQPGPVVVGQKIANEDETGFTVGEHLHYEVRVNGRRVNPTDYMSANLNYSQPPGDNFSGFSDQNWGSCDVLPQPRGSVPITVPPTASSEFFIFSDSGEKAWTQAEKDLVSKAILTPVKSSTWKGLVFNAGKVTLTRSSVDTECPTVCSGFANSSNSLVLRDLFFNLTDSGRVFVITHELTHLLQQRSPQAETDFRNSSAFGEFQSKGVIASYPLCDGQTCLFGLSPFNENFAEASANYVSDRDNRAIDFPTLYPEHFKFVRDKLFGGTSF